MKNNKLNRRKFFAMLGLGSLVLAVRSFTDKISGRTYSVHPPDTSLPVQTQTRVKPATNIADALKTPRTQSSMPGLFPGKVVHIKSSKSVTNNVPVEPEAYKMIAKGLSELTEEKDLKKAWLTFVKPGEKIGLKVNPVAGKELATSHEVTRSVIKQLISAGMKKEDIIIWDRREMDLWDCGFTAENYPGIKIMGTASSGEVILRKDENSVILQIPVVSR